MYLLWIKIGNMLDISVRPPKIKPNYACQANNRQLCKLFCVCSVLQTVPCLSSTVIKCQKRVDFL